jgi:propanol-preferring alcohol dehydrogenase
MKAVQLRTPRGGPEVVSIDEPRPGPGEALLKVTAAGLCQSDFKLMDMAESLVRRRFPLPLTLGHEGVGTVVALGAGGGGVAEGEAVAVYGPRGCGRCRPCAQGVENYCPYAGRLGIRPPGLGQPGALAEYMVVDSVRHLVPIGELDPVQAAPLTDAGLTAYHAIERSRPKLVPDSTALVIGVGGLGHLAIQLLRATTSAQIIALDVTEDRLCLAAEVGAHEVQPSDRTAAQRVRKLTGGRGADAVLDFVGTAETAAIAGSAVALAGAITMVGTGGGALPVSFSAPAQGVTVGNVYWGSRAQLIDLVELARRGLVSARVETYPLDLAPEAYDRLRNGGIRGRAVVVPDT